MHQSELAIFQALLGRRILGLSIIRSYQELNKPSEIDCFGELMLSFSEFNASHNRHYIGIDPRCSGGSGNKLFFLTQWKYIHKPLAESIYYPGQNVDSKFKSGFGCSHLGKLNSLSLYHHEQNSGLLRMTFQNGIINLIISAQYIQIYMDSSKTLKDIQHECFDGAKGTELLNIASNG